MAKKSAAKKPQPKREEKEKGNNKFNGLRRGELVGKQVERWQERKWPLEKHPAEWLKFGHVLRALGEVLIIDATRQLNPAALVPRKLDVSAAKHAGIDEAEAAKK